MVENNDTSQQNTNNNNDNNQADSNQQTPTSSSGCIYDKYGRTPDKKYICGIGLPSAGADQGSGFQKCVFENKCPHCGHDTLKWGWNFGGSFEGASEGGTAEGHFFCVQADGGCDADYSAQGHEHIDGSSYNMTMVSGPTKSTKEEAEQLVAGQLPCDGIGGGTAAGNNGGGSAVKIPDLTFFGLIRQILGAVDGVFIVANNMAFLLSFKQFFTYRDQYEDLIPELKPADIVTDSIVRNWTTQGLYNSVEVTYADGIVKMQHDALVEVYGENIFYYEFPEDDEETAKAKADALLSAHVRDYSLDLQFNCIYNPNITVGSWIKIPKTLSKVTGATSKTTGEMADAKKDKPRKRKGVDITNINEVVQEIDDTSKTFQKITTDDGEEYEVEIEKKEYEIYFVQGYKLKWTPKKSPIMSLHLKYGPDTPEDPINATIGTGGVQSSAGGGGGYGNDCFWIGEIMPNNNAEINSSHTLTESDLQKPEFQPQPQHYAPRCKKGSNLDKDMQGKTPQEVHNAVRGKFGYCWYAESSELWPCVSDMYDQACGTNCGDGARILKCALDAINIKAWGIHIHGHYFNAAEIDGKVVALDATGYYSYSNTAGWPAGPKPAKCCEPGQADKVRIF